MVDDGEDWRGYYAEAKMHVRRACDRDAGHCPDRLQFSGARRLTPPPSIQGPTDGQEATCLGQRILIVT